MNSPLTSNFDKEDRPEFTEGQFLILLDHIIHNVDLPNFLETEAGCNIQFQNEESGVCCCPLHGERQPSFRINLMDGVWIFHCFGCGAKGHIIHFFMDFYGIPNKFEAVMQICDRFGFESTTDMFLDGLKHLRKRVDIQKDLECTHIATSNQCRMLLRNNFALYNKWVVSAYKRLNDALDNNDVDEVRDIGFEASNKAMEI